MWKGLKFAKNMCFMNLIAESDTSNLILALNTHEHYSIYFFEGTLFHLCRLYY
ncbi:hypothetical protein MtrunA17_Chr5g0426611 [Medicago truncatula]|uniref:Uncharacterized protein n=1 Tax=Medicago truncatula TaxID=3880 RepID=A0A396HXP2_MEDTR|nr:hypothetical protein MtrunA17_Chr5g0426611 [Medicago truncatula]